MDAPHPDGGTALIADDGSAGDPVPDAGAPGRLELAVVKQRVRRPLGRLFWAAATVTPLLLTAALVTSQAPALEEAVAANAERRLDGPKFAGVRVNVDGRQVTARVPAGTDAERVEQVLAAAPGVASVQSSRGFASAAEKRACEGLQAKVDRATGQQRIPFVGTSAQLTSTGSRMVAQSARLLKACGPAVAVVGGHADGGVGDAASLSLARARTIAQALKRQGIAADRLETRGYGDQFPLETRNGAQNHRGTITVRVS